MRTNGSVTHMGHPAHRGGEFHAGDKDTVDRIDAGLPLPALPPSRLEHSFLTSSFAPSSPLSPSASLLPFIIRSSRGCRPPQQGGLHAPIMNASALLPRASLRSYNDRLSALTESTEAFLPRALKHSYRERRVPLQNTLNKGLVAPLWVVEERCSVGLDRRVEE